MSLTDIGIGQSVITMTLFSSILIPLGLTTKPKYPTISWQKLHLSILMYNLASYNRQSTCQTCFLQSFGFLEKMRISSKYTIYITSIRPFNTLSIQDYYIVEAFASPKGITRYSKWLYLVRKAVFYLSPSRIQILQYASFRSNLVNIWQTIGGLGSYR